MTPSIGHRIGSGDDRAAGQRMLDQRGRSSPRGGRSARAGVEHPQDLSPIPWTWTRERGPKGKRATLIVLRVPRFEGEAADCPMSRLPLGSF